MDVTLARLTSLARRPPNSRTPWLHRAARLSLVITAAGILAGLVLTPTAFASTGDFVISGRGYGHGAGMSQWGAWEASREGVPYEDILAFYYPGTTLSTISPDQLVKVRLTRSSNTYSRYYQVDLKPTVTGATLVMHDATGDTTLELTAGSSVSTLCVDSKVQVDGSGSYDWVEVQPVSTDGRVAVAVRATSASTAVNYEYWGTIRVDPGSATALRLYNTVLMERYLRSVAEIDPGWASTDPRQSAPEAVKAQQTAARTYAMGHGTATDHFYDSTTDQVYLGYGWEVTHPGVKAAVDATAGKILTYGGKPINAYFSSSSGGYLTNSAWSDTSAPAYIVAKPDPWSLKAPVAPWAISPGYPWKYTFSPAAITTKLGLGVGTVTNIEVTSRDTSDADSHVRSLRVTGTSGSTTISGRSFKAKLGLKSTLVLSIATEGTPGTPGTIRYQQTDSHLTFAGTWATFSTSGASGGSYKRASANGASVTVALEGTYLAWIATKGTTLGKAFVSLDGGPAVGVDLGASAVAYQQKVWDSGTLTAGAHSVTIWRDPSSATGKYISVDAFDVIGSLAQAPSPARYQQTDSHLAFAGTWATFSTSGASGGSYKRANTSGASVTITFDGTYLAWIATRGTTLGRALVSLDGGTPQQVNLAATSVQYQQNVWNTGRVTSGVHTVKIWRDPTNIAGKYISVDAVELLGTFR